MPRPPSGISVVVGARGVELGIARPGRVRVAVALALALGIAAAFAVLVVAIGKRGQREVGFVAATLLVPGLAASIRAAVLGGRALRLILDAERLAVENPRPWAHEDLSFPREALAAVEQTPNGIAARRTDGAAVPIVGDLTFEQLRYVERILTEALQRT